MLKHTQTRLLRSCFSPGPPRSPDALSSWTRQRVRRVKEMDSNDADSSPLAHPKHTVGSKTRAACLQWTVFHLKQQEGYSWL